ncbi:hypothetical protein ACHAXR_001289 [Thalassiosira sp. AJA248-18]
MRVVVVVVSMVGALVDGDSDAQVRGGHPSITPKQRIARNNRNISMYWYPKADTEGKLCTIGSDFPYWMNYLANTYLFDTERECCAIHHCEEPQYWYPDLLLTHGKACRRDAEYPPWMASGKNAPLFLFAVQEDCCALHGCDDLVEATSPKPETDAPDTNTETNAPTLRQPTAAPEQLPVCPETYDPSIASSYGAGSEVEVNQVMYRCRGSLMESYCARSKFRPGAESRTLWIGAWETVGPCSSPASLPTFSPSVSVSPTNTSESNDPDQTSLPNLPALRFTQWEKLNSEKKMIAKSSLGYIRNSWNNFFYNEIENNMFEELPVTEQQGVETLGLDAATWDCYINHYIGYYWSGLEAERIANYEILGWNETMWAEELDVPDTEEMYWDELSPQQQQAALNVCYSKNSWDGIPLGEW